MIPEFINGTQVFGPMVEAAKPGIAYALPVLEAGASKIAEYGTLLAEHGPEIAWNALYFGSTVLDITTSAASLLASPVLGLAQWFSDARGLRAAIAIGTIVYFGPERLAQDTTVISNYFTHLLS